MSRVKAEIKNLLENLPDDCTIEDVQYHLYVMEKIQKGIDRAEKEDSIPHEEAKKRLKRWLSE